MTSALDNMNLNPTTEQDKYVSYFHVKALELAFFVHPMGA